MNKKTLLLSLQSVLCVVLTALLIAAVIGSFREGAALKAEKPLEWIFTREKAAAALAPLLPLLALSLALTAAGLVLRIRDERAEAPVKDVELLRDLTVSRVKAPSAEMRAERAGQKKLLYGGRALFALCMIPVLLYLTNAGHFPNGDLEPVFLALLGHTLPWIALGFAALTISSVLREKSMRREIDAAGERLRAEKTDGVAPEAEKKETQQPCRLRLLRTALIVLALLLIAAGVFNGSARDVFGKAVKICTECVGLG